MTEARTNPIVSLLRSRKFVLVLLTALVSVAGTLGARWGLELDVQTTVALTSPVVLALLASIFGIAYEDGQEKRGTGMTTSTTTTDGATITNITNTAPMSPDEQKLAIDSAVQAAMGAHLARLGVGQ